MEARLQEVMQKVQQRCEAEPSNAREAPALTRIRKLKQRLDKVTPLPQPPDDRGIYGRLARARTKEEKFAFIRLIRAWEEGHPTGTKEPNDAWLASRPSEEQAAIKKVKDLLERLEKEKSSSGQSRRLVTTH